MVTDMKIAVEAARALTYETSRICDFENNNTLVLELHPPTDKDEAKVRKELGRTIKRLNGMLTPMSKYYASEMCNRVADTALQVLGGSGYMTDYPAERYLRDARITNIYEGTSQLQIVAAVRGVCSGAFEKRILEFEAALAAIADNPLAAELQPKLVEARMHVLNAITFVKSQSTEYMDLMGRRLVDAAAAVYIGHLLLQQALGIRVRVLGGVRMPTAGTEPARCDPAGAGPSRDAAARQRKAQVVRRFLAVELPKVAMNCALAQSGDRTPLEQYELLAGPVPARE
jgi:hypothetical protein